MDNQQRSFDEKNVQRSSFLRVGKFPKWGASLWDDDMIYTLWKHKEKEVKNDFRIWF